MRLTPEIMLLGDHTMSRLRWTLERETERIDELRRDNPEVDELMTSNGWDSRMLAWGHLLDGWLDVLDFDDEKGRTG